MNITIENIDELRARANVGYKEAKEALTHTEGDIVEALVYLEENGVNTRSKKKVRDNMHKKIHNFENNETVKNAKTGFVALMKKKFVVSKAGKTYLNIPLFLAILLVCITEGFGLLVLCIGYFTGFKYSFDGKTCNQENEQDVVKEQL